MKADKIRTIIPDTRINYDFGSMEEGEIRRIKVRKDLRDRTLYNLRSAVSREKKGLLFDVKCWAEDSGVYYERIEREA